MSCESLLRLINIVDELELSKYSMSYISEDSEYYSEISNTSSVQSQIEQRDIVIDSLRKAAKINVDLPESSRDAINAIKTQYDKMINEMTEKFLKEKRETERTYLKEIRRLRGLIEEHREKLKFQNLPKLSKCQYDEINTSPQSNVSLVQFLAAQLYEYNRDQSIKYQRLTKEHTEMTKEIEKLRNVVLTQERKLCSETSIRESLEKDLLELSQRNPPQPMKLPEHEVQDKLEKCNRELEDTRSAYHAAVARNDLLLDSLNKANSKLQEYEANSQQDKNEIQSLQSRLESVQEELEQQNKLLDRRDEELRDLKQRHTQLLSKTLQSF